MSESKLSEKPVAGASPGEMRGWANVKKSSGLSRWKEGYVVLQEGTFMSFKDDTLAVGTVTIVLNGWTVRELEKKETPKHCDYGLRLVGMKKGKATELMIAFATADAQAAWNEAITFAVFMASPTLFGIPLRAAFAKGGYRRCPAPIRRLVTFLEKANALNMSGIFRVSASQGEVVRLRDAFNEGADDRLEQTIAEITDFNVVSSVIKLYLRELPDPLLTHERYSAFVDAAGNTAKIAEIVASLPKEHLFTLQFLIKFLAKVAAKSAENMMTSRNLAVVFGPTILSADLSDSATAQSAAVQAEPVIVVCENMIDRYDAIFKNVEKEAAADADKPRHRPTPIATAARDDSDDEDKEKEKDKKKPAPAGPLERSPTGPTPLMPAIVPGAVKLKPVADSTKKTPRDEDPAASGGSVLGPHMLRKSAGPCEPVAPAAVGQNAELMAKLAKRASDPTAALAASAGTAEKPAGAETDGRPKPAVEGRPTPGPKPVPKPVHTPGQALPQASRPTPPVPPSAAAKEAAKETSASAPPMPPRVQVTPPAGTAASSTSGSASPVHSREQRKSMPPQKTSSSSAPGFSVSAGSSTPNADELEPLRVQLLEAQATVQKLQERDDAHEERIAGLEGITAAQAVLIKKLEEDLLALREAFEKKEKEEKEKHGSHGREKSMHKKHKSRSKHDGDAPDPDASPRPDETSQSPPPPMPESPEPSPQ